MGGKVRVLILLCAFALALHAQAKPFDGRGFSVHRVHAPDGAELTLYELHGNKTGPVVLLGPGLVETAEALDGAAFAFQQRGYRVFVGQVRLVGRGENRSGAGPRNRLLDVARLDLPTLVEGTLRVSGASRLHYFGHSMGGMIALAAFSDPMIRERLEPKIEAVTLLAAPHHLHALSPSLRLAVRGLLPVLRGIRNLTTQDAWAHHHQLFDWFDRLERSRNPMAASIARNLRNAAVSLGTRVFAAKLIDLNHTSPRALRRLWREELSVLPLDVLVDFAQAAVVGEFEDLGGEKLLTPESFSVPTQVLFAEKDLLVPPHVQSELFERLGTPIKRIVKLVGHGHVGVITHDHPAMDFMPLAIDFHDDPLAAHAQGAYRVVNPCGEVLKSQKR